VLGLRLGLGLPFAFTMFLSSLLHSHCALLEIDRYGFLGADANISAIHGLIPIFPKFLNLLFCFIIKNNMYSMPYLFFKNFKNQEL